MTINEIASLLSSVGFPIIAWYLMWKQNTEILEEMRRTIDKNTLAFNELKIEIAKKGGERDED